MKSKCVKEYQVTSVVIIDGSVSQTAAMLPARSTFYIIGRDTQNTAKCRSWACATF